MRPVFGVGAGIQLFPGRPFLPGASGYEFLLTYGLGATVQLSPRWDLTLDTRYTHLSNGQGLGPQNPAFDGAGGGLTSSWSFGDRVVERPPPVPHSDGRSGWTPGVIA